MTAPRLEVDLEALTANARTLVDRLAPRGIRVTGIAKAACGSPGIARALLRGGCTGLGDSRVENLAKLAMADIDAPLTLIRSPMLSQIDDVVRHAAVSLNTEAVVLDALSEAATRLDTVHGVVLMVELGDLREGVPADAVVDLARSISRRPSLALAGLGTNLACQSGVVPDQLKMDELSRLVEEVEAACHYDLSIVSGGNSASLEWALSADDVGRVDEVRLGQALLLGTEPLRGRPVDGLRTDACRLVAEVIEVQTKPAQPWGDLALSAFGTPSPRPGQGTTRQGILALGRQDADPDGLTLPAGITLLGMSSDHLVVDLGDHDLRVGDEVSCQLDYSALVRAMTSPYVEKVELEPAPASSHLRIV